MNIVHITSAHGRNDIRVFVKECGSLASAGHRVSLLVADGKPDEQKEGISIIGVQRESSRLKRFVISPRRLYAKAKTFDAELFHIHDPELLGIGARLARKGKKVIFDAHEDLPKQVMSKPYLAKPLRIVISILLKLYERIILINYSAIVAATPSIGRKFSRWHSNVEVIKNYPLAAEFNNGRECAPGSPLVCYIGGISRIRGATEMVKAMALTKGMARLALAGPFSPLELEGEILSLSGSGKVDYLGVLDRQEVSKLLSRSIAGLVPFHPEPNHVEAQPNKLFEYMSAGVPVIASNFPLWKDLIETNACGLCVDPLDPESIAKAIDMMESDLSKAEAMGRNGKAAVLEKYNWECESKALISLYDRLGRELR